MKLPLFLSLLLSVLIVLSFSTSARRLLPAKPDGDLLSNSRPTETAGVKLQQDFLSNLMGSEENCDEKDEECFKRRMIAEAHLDYIYTQHNKP